MEKPEMDFILKHVQNQKQKAIDLNLMEIIEHLYDDLRFMPSALQRQGSPWTDLVSEASYLSKDQKLRKIQIKLNSGNGYIVIFNNNSNVDDMKFYEDCTVTGGHKFSLHANDQRVLGLKFEAVSDNEFPVAFYRAIDISAFKEGEWIKDLEKLHLVNRIESEKLVAKIEEDRLKQLKEDFGIE